MTYMKFNSAMEAKNLTYLLKKLCLSWKTTCMEILKNRERNKKVILGLLFILTWLIGARCGLKQADLLTNKTNSEDTLQNSDTSVESTELDREQEINLIAKVLYGYRYNSDLDLEGIVWVILNRVDNQAEFQNFETIQEVVKQPSQWMGYSEDNPVIENLYDIASSVVSKYDSDGKRLFGKEYLYFEWSNEYILFKTELYDSSTCRVWRAY